MSTDTRHHRATRPRSASPSSRPTAPPTRPRRSSCCSTAAARTSRRSCRWHRTCRTAWRMRRCGRRSPRAVATRGSPTAASVAPSPSRSTRPWAGSGTGWMPSRRRAAGRPRRVQRRSRLRRRAGPGRPRPATPGPRSSTAPCPSTPGCRSTPAGWRNLPVFVAQGEADQVIPRELLDRTWEYLHRTPARPPSAAATRAATASPPPPCTGCPSWVADRLGPCGPRGGAGRGPGRRRVADAAGCRAAAPRRVRGPRCRGTSRSSSCRRTPRPSCSSAVRAGRQACGSRPAVPHLRARRPRLLLSGRWRPGRGLPRARRAGSSRTCTRLRRLAHLTLPAPLRRPTWWRTAGVFHPWAGTRLSPGFVMLFGPRTAELETVVGIVRPPTRSPPRQRPEGTRPWQVGLLDQPASNGRCFA